MLVAIVPARASGFLHESLQKNAMAQVPRKNCNAIVSDTIIDSSSKKVFLSMQLYDNASIDYKVPFHTITV